MTLVDSAAGAAAANPRAEILDFTRGVQILRGPAAVASIERRIKIRRREAYARCYAGDFQKADRCMFGSHEQILVDGPDAPPPRWAGA